jgi:hypothetical protein
MHRSVSHRIFAIVLVLTHLVLGSLMHLPTAQAAVGEPSRPMMMMGGEPCPGMAGTPADQPSPTQAGHPRPANDGTCCKSPQCPCLQAPALMGTLQMPMVFSISYADVPPAEVHRISGPPAVFFRPPI